MSRTSSQDEFPRSLERHSFLAAGIVPPAQLALRALLRYGAGHQRIARDYTSEKRRVTDSDFGLTCDCD